MAIRLASAIGSQRTPVDILGGLDDAINKTGDAIQAAKAEKEKEAAKKRDSALQSAINVNTNIDAMAKDNKTYKETADKLISEAFSLHAKGASAAEIQAKQKEIEDVLTPMKYRFEKDKKDFDDIYELANSAENRNKFDFSEAESFLTGQSRREVPMPMQAPSDRAMPLNKEDSDVTEVVDVQTKPYWDKTLEERQSQAPSSIFSEYKKRLKDITGNFNDASKGVFGSDYNPQQQYSKVFTTQNADGTTVQEVKLDTEEAARDKSKFLSTVGTELGDTKTQQYWRTLANKAGAAGKRAGFYGEKLNKFVEQQVINQASTDWDNAIQQDIEKTKISKVDNAKFREGKGMTLNFTSGGGGSSKIWNIGDAAEAPLYEVKDGKKTDKVIGDYYYHSTQTVAGSENPKKFNIAGHTDVQVQGVNVNKKTGKPEYVDITIPARYDKRDKLVKGTGIKKTVRISSDQEIEDLKANLGKDLYNGTIGSHKPEKVAAAKKVDLKGKKYAGIDANGNPIFK